MVQKANSDEDVTALFDMVQKVFQKMLECMARSFKKQPEEGLRVLNLTGEGGWTLSRLCSPDGWVPWDARSQLAQYWCGPWGTG